MPRTPVATSPPGAASGHGNRAANRKIRSSHSHSAVIDAHSGWCGPCKALAGFIKTLKTELSDPILHFATVSVPFFRPHTHDRCPFPVCCSGSSTLRHQRPVLLGCVLLDQASHPPPSLSLSHPCPAVLHDSQPQCLCSASLKPLPTTSLMTIHNNNHQLCSLQPPPFHPVHPTHHPHRPHRRRQTLIT